MRILSCLLCSAALWPAADLPDMRWLFERALRLDARSDVHRFDRVRAWALIPLLYPDDVPRTENDDIWRFVARDALRRLDASAAGHPPPQAPVLPPAEPADPLRDLLGVRVASAPGGLEVREVPEPGSGLQPGDRILAIGGTTVATPADAARLAVAAGGRVELELDGGRGLAVRCDGGRPQLVRLSLRGELPAWQDARRWPLPPLDGAWLVEGVCDPALTASLDGVELRPPPGASGWSAIASRGACTVSRRGLAGGAFALAATPLRGDWREIRLDAGKPMHRLVLGVRAGQALVVESAGAEHTLSVRGPAGDAWWEDRAHRIVRHGPAGAMAAAAIERNGMAEIAVRPSTLPATVRLRILSDPPVGVPAP